MRSMFLCFMGAMLVTACSGAGGAKQIAAPASTSATLSLKSALVQVEEPAEVTVSCRGGTVCKELVAPREAADAIAEAKEDCTHRGGQVSAEACPRGAVVGTCELGGGAGPIRVFTYAQDHVERMTELCGAADGELDLGK
jgi:putative hemolysin